MKQIIKGSGLNLGKLKIINLNNTDDSYWFKLEPKIETLFRLDDIFNMFELLPNNKIPKNSSFLDWLESNPTEFLIDDKRCLVYIIITKKHINVIVRKINEHDKVKEAILDEFDFKQ